MLIKYADRVADVTQTVGLVSYALDSNPPASYQHFDTVFATTDKFYYCCTNGTDWEVGQGELDTGTPDLCLRTTILASSNAGSAVDWSAGEKEIFLVNPASRLGKLENFQVASQGNLGETVASGVDSIAVGDNARAYENTNIAIGESARAGINSGAGSEPAAIAIGHDSIAYEGYCISIGAKCETGQSPAVSANYAIAIGYDNLANKSQALALGYLCLSQGSSSVAIGVSAVCKESHSVSIGYTATCGQTPGGTVESNCIAIGDADSYELGCIAIGDGTKAGDATTSASPYSVAIGATAAAGSNSAVTPVSGYAAAFGYGAKAYEKNCVALGASSTAGVASAPGATYAVGIGGGSNASAYRALAVGVNSTVSGEEAAGFGFDADAREQRCLALGDSQAGQTGGGTTQVAAVAVGYLAKAYEARSVAIGNSAQAGSTSGSLYVDSIAIGSLAYCLGKESVALGHSAQCNTAHFAVAIGAECEANGDYNVAIGNLTEVRDRYAVAIGYSNRTGQLSDGTNAMYGIAIGYDNIAYEQYQICLGSSNVLGGTSGVTAQYSMAIGHNHNIVGFEGVVAMGRGVTAARDHEWVYGIDPADDEIRRGHMGWAVQTTDATPTKLKVNFDGLDYMKLGTDAAIAFDILIVGAGTTEGKKAAYRIEGGVYRESGDPIWLGSSPLITVLGEGDAALDCTLGIDTVNDGFYIEVTGLAANTIKWAANMQFVEIDN